MESGGISFVHQIKCVSLPCPAKFFNPNSIQLESLAGNFFQGKFINAFI